MPMSHDDIQQRVIDCIATTMHLEPHAIRPDATFDELKIDSLDGVNIIFALEEAFAVEVPEESAKQTRSVGDLTAGIARLLAQKDPSA